MRISDLKWALALNLRDKEKTKAAVGKQLST